MADDLISAGESKLNNAILSAEQAINTAFGDGGDLTGNDAYRFLDYKRLMEVYRVESQNLSIIVENFSNMAKSIKSMRSSYLPIELMKSINNTFDSTVSDTTSEMESYENAFMRMLGMPSTSDSRLSTANEILYINYKGELNSGSYEDIEKNILNERNAERGFRSVVINNSIYNINNLPSSFINIINNAEETTNIGALIAGDLTSATEHKEDASKEARITDLQNDIFKFSYLLIPPVQDGRISGCINEPDKIIAAPFSSKRGRVVNEKKIKPSLLESVIRIRLDRLSGTDTFFNTFEEDEGNSLTLSVSVGEESIPVNSNSYGILESLFILRLRAAIGGLGYNLSETIEDFMSTSESVKLIPQNNANINKNAKGKDSDLQADDNISSSENDLTSEANVSKNLLNEQLVIEDAIMSLIIDNSESLDLQTQTQRTSSVHDGHLMSGIIGIVDLPRQRIQKTLVESEETKAGKNDVENGESTASINTIIGISNGVGTIDIAIFALALFSMSEEGLIGLLLEKDYENLIKNNYANLPAVVVQKSDLIDSINELTQLIIAGYKLFQKELGNQDAEPGIE